MAPALVVAEITKDHLWSGELDMPNFTEVNYKGTQFEYPAMLNWWGWNDLPDVDGWIPKAQTKFRLYDDDGELYYEGWLHDDDQGIVQQFVLDWAKYDSGCTVIKVHKAGEYVQEIG